jgi:hypothetical protein
LRNGAIDRADYYARHASSITPAMRRLLRGMAALGTGVVATIAVLASHQHPANHGGTHGFAQVHHRA